MALTLWTTAALVVWLVLWSLSYKAIDAMLISSLLLIVGITLHILKNYLPNRS